MLRRLSFVTVLIGYGMLVPLGASGEEKPTASPATTPLSGIGINELEDYTQWKRAIGAGEGTDPSTFLVPPGFEIERLRSAAPDEGSWVSLAIDPRGRVVIAKEERGLLRLTLPAGQQPLKVESIDDTLLECRGLLFAWGDLYANANNSKGLYRLRDTDGDDRFDETKLLYQSEGGVGHGRNDLVLGPDNLIYSIHGDSVEMPKGCRDATSPLREHRRAGPHPRPSPNGWERGSGAASNEGHVVRMDRDGQHVELVAAGLRNPFGIDFNPDGEMFTYDADAEHDMGAPWYRPTRVVHLVRGADYGWRAVTGSWPPYYPDHPDNALPNIDIGKGSPTAVKFGTRSNYPLPLRQALFVLDWAYGRILAIHMKPRGASYECRAETFLKGRPLNVTDLDFGPDGAMYFVTGGRKTQSALYRVRYRGPETSVPPSTEEEMAAREAAAKARQLRRELESLGETPDPQAVEIAWPHLGSNDPWIRYAARGVIERQPVDTWRERALSESRPTAAVTALLALARTGDAASIPRLLRRLSDMSLDRLSVDDLLAALYCVEICLTDTGPAKIEIPEKLLRQLDALYPHRSGHVNQRLSSLLVRLAAPRVVERTLALLETNLSQPEQLHALFVLRGATDWSRTQRLRYAAALRRSADFQGGEGMPKFRERIRNDWLAAIRDDERREYEKLLEETPIDLPAVVERPLVKTWRLEDLVDSLPSVGGARNRAQGKQTFATALCVRCHRMGFEGAAIGPDLTSVARRFSRRDILESILTPSKVVADPYRMVRIVTRDGRVLTGQVIPATDYRSPKLRIAADPARPGRIIEIDKTEIESHEVSPLSTMPEGLLNSLTQDEILDLLAYLEAGGEIGTQMR